MKTYVLGFAFNLQSTEVLLIHKARPTAQAGLWNGIGGKIEDGEAPLDAMVREFAEETGLLWPKGCWDPAGTYGDGSYFEIHLFASRGDLTGARSLTDEPVAIHALSAVPHLPALPDLGRQLAHLKDIGFLAE